MYQYLGKYQKGKGEDTKGDREVGGRNKNNHEEI